MEKMHKKMIIEIGYDLNNRWVERHLAINCSFDELCKSMATLDVVKQDILNEIKKDMMGETNG